MSWITGLLVIVFFLILKGFFSGSEIAMVNSDKLKLKHQAKLGNKGARLVLKLFEKPDVILGTTLVGTNLATVIISTIGTLLFIDLFGSSGDLISVLFLTPILLIFGEVVPKSVFQQKADTIVNPIIYILRFFSYLFYPLIMIFSFVARFATRVVGGGEDPQNTMFITREEIRVLLDLSESASASASESTSIDRKRIRRIIRFADTTIGEAMIPLADVVGLNETKDMKEAIHLVTKYGFNRLPVFQGNLTNVKGVLTLDTWSLLELNLEKKPVADFTHSTLYLSPKQTIDKALPLLQARDDHMAIIVDEYGSAIGILTMEDIFEEVVGEINVGYDFEEYQPNHRGRIVQEDENTHIMSGRMPISEVNDVLYASFPVEGVHTIGGFIISHLLNIPNVGDMIEEQGYKLTVMEADERSVLKVKIEHLKSED